MRRKLIAQGGGGYTIYLPKAWVEAQGLGAGDDVSIAEQDGTLEIAAPGAKKERRVELTFTVKDWHDERPEKYVQRILAVAYKQGAEEIVVRCKDRRIMDYIEQRVDGFIGIEIVDQATDSLTIKSLAEGSDLDLHNVVQRCLHITRHIAKETPAVLGKPDETANLLRMERTHNKLTDFAKRLLTRRHVPDEKYLYALILEDERLVDEYKALLQAYKRRPPRDLMHLIQDVADYLEILLSLIATTDPERIKQLSAQYVPLRDRAKRALRKDKEGTVLHLHNIVVRTYELGETVLEWKMPTRPLG